mgnify:CR=1 FL=1
MRKYDIKIRDVESKNLTVLDNASIKTILHTLKTLCKNDVPIELMKSKNSKRPKLYKNQYNDEVLNEIENFNTPI